MWYFTNNSKNTSILLKYVACLNKKYCVYLFFISHVNEIGNQRHKICKCFSWTCFTLECDIFVLEYFWDTFFLDLGHGCKIGFLESLLNSCMYFRNICEFFYSENGLFLFLLIILSERINDFIYHFFLSEYCELFLLLNLEIIFELLLCSLLIEIYQILLLIHNSRDLIIKIASFLAIINGNRLEVLLAINSCYTWGVLLFLGVLLTTCDLCEFWHNSVSRFLEFVILWYRFSHPQQIASLHIVLAFITVSLALFLYEWLVAYTLFDHFWFVLLFFEILFRVICLLDCCLSSRWTCLHSEV